MEGMNADTNYSARQSQSASEVLRQRGAEMAPWAPELHRLRSPEEMF